MRRYADPVEVRQGHVDGPGAGVEGPEQFLWRGRLWKVRAVLAHWVETGPWWQSAGVRSVIGAADERADERAHGRSPTPLGDLITERELWRVEAGRGRPRPHPAGQGPGGGSDGEPDGVVSGVFDLSFDWAEGRWLLVGCAD